MRQDFRDLYDLGDQNIAGNQHKGVALSITGEHLTAKIDALSSPAGAGQPVEQRREQGRWRGRKAAEKGSRVLSPTPECECPPGPIGWS